MKEGISTENVIFYFTGTGNSLMVARTIAEKLGDTRLVPVSDALKNPNFDWPCRRIGFVFPAYYASLPPMVRDLVSALHFNPSAYVFGVTTFAGAYGMCLAQLQSAVRKGGGVLNAGFFVRMPGNYILEYGAYPRFFQKVLLDRAERKISKLVTRIREKQPTRIPQGSALIRSTEQTDLKILNGFGDATKDWHTNEKCTGCGICQKICPAGNINMADSRPVWGNSCKRCMACIQWCPQQAIQYGGKTETRQRYRNPEVQLSDLLGHGVYEAEDEKDDFVL